MAPHKKTEEQSTRALGPIQPGGPVTFPRPSIQSGSGYDIDFIVHCTSCPQRSTFSFTVGERKIMAHFVAHGLYTDIARDVIVLIEMISLTASPCDQKQPGCSQH